MRIELIAGERSCIGTLKLRAELQLRLLCFAKANKLDHPKMIERSLWFAMAAEDQGPGLSAPDDADIVRFAAETMFRAAA